MHVFLIAAMTADGFIARDASHLSTKWTSKADAQFFSERTKKAGACIMGSTTFDTIQRPLPGRTTYVLTRQPEKYLQWGEQVQPFSITPEQLLHKLEHAGQKEVAICGGTSVYTQFMQLGLVDRMYLTIEPVVFGTGLRLFNAPLELHLSLEHTHSLSDQTIVQEYVITSHH